MQSLEGDVCIDREGARGHTSRRMQRWLPRGGTRSNTKGQVSTDKVRPNEGEGDGRRKNLGDGFKNNI